MSSGVPCPEPIAPLPQPGGSLARVIVCAVPRLSRAGGPDAAPGLAIARRLTELGEAVNAVVLAPAAVDQELAGATMTVVDFQPVELSGYWNGEGVSDGDVVRFADALVQAAHGASWVVLSGGLPRGMPLYVYQEAIPRLREAGARVGVLLRGEVLGATLVADPDLCIVEASEAAAALGIDVSDPSGASRAASRFRAGAQRTAVVIASNGVGVSDALRDTWVIPGSAVDPVDLAATMLVGDTRHGDLFALLPEANA